MANVILYIPFLIISAAILIFYFVLNLIKIMDNNGRVRIKKLSDLMQKSVNPVSNSKTPKGKCKGRCEIMSESDSDFVYSNATPKRVKNQKEVPTTSKKTSPKQDNLSKKVPKSNKKEPPPSQTKIYSYFKSCSKTYQVEKTDLTNGKDKVNQTTGGKFNKNRGKNVRNMGRGRKRLFDDTTETDSDTTTESTFISGVIPKRPVRKRFVKNSTNKSEKNYSVKKKSSVVECIDLISESGDENCKQKEKGAEKEFQSASVAMQINNENTEDTPRMAQADFSEETTTDAVRNVISICQTNDIYLGNIHQVSDLGTLQNVIQHESSEIGEDIGTLIQKEDDLQLQSSDAKVLIQAHVNKAEAIPQMVCKTEHQLSPCYTNKLLLVDPLTTNIINQRQSSQIEVDIGTLFQNQEEEQNLQSTREEKAPLQTYVNKAEVEFQTVGSREHQLLSSQTNNTPMSDLGTPISINHHQHSEPKDARIQIQKEEKEENELKLQSILNEQFNKELRDMETKPHKASSPVYISSCEEDFLLPEIRCRRNTKHLEAKTKMSAREHSINAPEEMTSKEATLSSSMQESNSANINQGKPLPQANGAPTLNTTPEEARTKPGTRKRKPRPCPPYKVITGTTFAVDAFQFGLIKGVTHYFLSHFHADHYIGLTRKFAMPLFCSPVTARLLRVFIPLEERFVQEIELNVPQIIEGVEVSAIDANHCPGALMFVFKLPTGKCILHTGDFRASPNMESEPIFWNHDIHTIYLDTTYISNKYAFCSQDESIDKALHLIEQFQEKHKDKKILYICGAYLIGKERMWSTIARNNRLVVWTEARRNKALRAMQDLDYLELLCANSISATMHVIPMGKLNYFSLVEYFEPFSSQFDICLAIRPSGWEKNSKPQYRGKINIIGVEYSEHSSYNELQRFVTYLNPQEVISTVPASGNLMITSEVPKTWYKYKKFPTQHRNFQPSITNYLKLKTKNLPISEQNEESSKENFLPNQSSQSDEFENMKCSQKVSTDKLSLLHAADADDDWLS